ncbi:MAG TPA: hypothetical protein VG711_07970 [Phycisphaerales bacterium]|nr:hypothetical protein [Phycisphaerales bacterium]
MLSALTFLAAADIPAKSSSQEIFARETYPEARPPLRGFRAPILDHADELWPFNLPDVDSTPELHAASTIIQTQLASDGLLSTTAQIFAALPSKTLPADAAGLLDFFKRAGLPIDLLAAFIPSDQPSTSPAATLQSIQSLVLHDHVPASQIASRFSFAFQPSAPGFAIACEDGTSDFAQIRLQLPSARYWQGLGDGGAVDIARQLTERISSARFLIGIPSDQREAIEQLLAPGAHASKASVTYFSSSLTLAQWAQDNGKPGFISAASPKLATIVPRYASRGEDGATFIPGETFIADALAETGPTVIQSPLLFQGGNLLAYHQPSTGKKILLIGEAELYRNIALGLSQDQVLQAFCSEFNVDQCITLPAVSFHIDFELSIHIQGNRMLAFVNDQTLATQAILSCTLQPLVSLQLLSNESALEAAQAIRNKNFESALSIIMPPIMDQAVSPGRVPLSFAKNFAVGSSDSGVGNMQRILLAADLATACNVPLDLNDIDPDTQTYFRALRRLQSDRAALQHQLEDLGFVLVPIPSLADGSRCLNYVNMVQGKTRLLLPAYGGLFSPVDAQVRQIVQDKLGADVQIVQILTGETQRRQGGLHCAVSAYYEP